MCIKTKVIKPGVKIVWHDHRPVSTRAHQGFIQERTIRLEAYKFECLRLGARKLTKLPIE